MMDRIIVQCEYYSLVMSFTITEPFIGKMVTYLLCK